MQFTYTVTSISSMTIMILISDLKLILIIIGIDMLGWYCADTTMNKMLLKKNTIIEKKKVA